MALRFGIRSIIIAHFRGWERPVVIEEGAFLGPGVIVLPNVVIGRGSVVAAGSVVTTSVPPMTLVQGNPAKPVAQVGKAPQSGGEFSRIFVQPEALETKCPRGPRNRRCHPGTLSVSPVSGMNLLDFPLPSNLPRPVDDGERHLGLRVEQPDHLQHQQLVEIGVEQAADDGIKLPGVIVDPLGDVRCRRHTRRLFRQTAWRRGSNSR